MKNILLSLVAGMAFFTMSCSKSSEPEPDPVVTPPPAGPVETLKVMAYNIHHANPPSKPNVIDIDAIVNAINADLPDIVALQEVDVNTARSGAGNQAQIIAGKLRMNHYFYGKSLDYQGGEYGVAIISKYPLSDRKVHPLPTQPGSGGEPRVLATAIVTMPDGTTIRFGSTHLDAQSDHTNRKLQVERLREIAFSEPLPFIIAGDFNATPGSEVINLLDSSFRRTCQTCGPTIPASNPNKAIDFIAYKYPTSKLSTASHKVLTESYASDHRPVLAVLNIAK